MPAHRLTRLAGLALVLFALVASGGCYSHGSHHGWHHRWR
jgi:hypothetical protein